MLEQLAKSLLKEFQKKLPGFSAQKTMAPFERRSAAYYLKKGVLPKKSAVLILLYPQVRSGAVKTVLIVRPKRKGAHHSGQISFPGGSFDPSDGNMADTALREAEEEIGIERNTVNLLGALSPLYVPVSNFMVYPFVGAVSTAPGFKIQPLEVKELLEVSLRDLSSKKNKRVAAQFVKTKEATLQVPSYYIGDKIVWGATAMIIAEFLAIIRRIK
jgi:8-oxo-dGTP pyrophosphatase MutT (NUDIX family)